MINIYDSSVGTYDDLADFCAESWAESRPFGSAFWRELPKQRQEHMMAFAQAVMEKYYAELQSEVDPPDW
jgi:hypothetical protein